MDATFVLTTMLVLAVTICLLGISLGIALVRISALESHVLWLAQRLDDLGHKVFLEVSDNE